MIRDKRPPHKSIVLIGYRCSGKSAAGRRLAEAWGLPFVDTDALVETRAGISIYQIFKTQGEAEFRRLERDVLMSLPTDRPQIVAAGGGIVASPLNCERLRELGDVVFLHASPDVTRKRMRRREREDGPSPSLTGRNWKDEVEDVLAQRLPLYRSAMDIELNADADADTLPRLIAAAIETL